MASIVQAPAALNLQAVGGSPFSVTVALVDSSGAALSGVTDPVCYVGREAIEQTSSEPSITNISTGKYELSWTADQTTALLKLGVCQWSFSVTLDSVGPQAVLGGGLRVNASYVPSSSTSSSETVTVDLGDNTVSATVTLAGGAVTSVESLTGAVTFSSPDSSVTIGTDGNAVTLEAASGVSSVTAGDGTITVGGTASAPTVKVTADTFDAYGAAEATVPTLTESGTQYVTTTGSDSNSGLSWASAKATIQAAINGLPANGGVVEVGYGTFSISSPITVVYGTENYAVTIRGRGMGQTYDATNNVSSPTHPTVIENTGTGDAIQVTGTSGDPPPSYGFLLQDLAVVGNSSSGNGLTISYGPRAKLRRVAFDEHGGWGFVFEKGCYWVDVDSVVATRCTSGGVEFVTDGNQLNLFLLTNCIFNSNTGWGAYATGGTALSFLNCDFSLNGSGGAYLGASGMTSPYYFTGCWFEKNSGSTQVNIVNGVTAALFVGTVFTGDSVSGRALNLNGPDTAVLLFGCTFGGHIAGSIQNPYASKISWQSCYCSDSSFIVSHPYSASVAAASAAIAGSFAQGFATGLYNQTLAASGAVTFDASAGNTYVETLGANATSSSITNGTPGQHLTIVWLQDSTGSRTYAWPTNCVFAGGAAPSASTAAGARDSVTFYFDGTDWYETGRAVGVIS